MRRVWVLILTSCVAVSTPGNNDILLSGIPFTSRFELIVAICIAMFAGFRHYRRQFASSLRIMRGFNYVAIVVIAGLIITLKLVIFALAPTSGEFEVCYRKFSARAGLPCLPTFEPLPLVSERSEHFPRRSTSVRFINFGPRQVGAEKLSTSNWRLPFVNSEDYDQGFWPWVDDAKDIETFPFWAEFRGRIYVAPDEQIQLTYVGQGRLYIGSSALKLEPAYLRPEVVNVQADAGFHDLRIDYGFLRTERYGGESNLPYSQLRLESERNEEIRWLEVDSPPIISILNHSIDLLSVVLFACLLWTIRGRWKSLLVSSGSGLGLWLMSQWGLTLSYRVAEIEVEVLILATATIWVIHRRWSVALLLPAYIAVSSSAVLTEVRLAIDSIPNLGHILVRLRGNDHLVYHALTREMLSSGFFRGGEDSFYFQPGIRYVFYMQQVLLGESGILTGVLSVVLLATAILLVLSRLHFGKSVLATSLQGLSVAAFILWWSSSHTMQSTIFGLSEFGTWILIFVMVGLMLNRLTVSKCVAVANAAASVVWIRPNQGISMVLFVVLATYLLKKSSHKSILKLASGIVAFILVLLLIPVHNVIFDKRLVFLPGGHLNAGQESWNTIFRAFNDASARDFMTGQMRALLYLPSALPAVFSPRLALAFMCFSLVIFGCTWMYWRAQTKDVWLVAIGVACGVGQVLPFFKYTLFRYFPIHNVAIYLTYVLIALLVVSRIEQEGHLQASTERGNR